MTRVRAIVVLVLVAAACAPVSAHAAAPPCRPWTMSTLTSGLGSLENIEPDGRGGLLLSGTGAKAILRLTPDGRTSVLVPDVEAPGGLRVRGSTLFFNTGDSAPQGALGLTDGTIDRFGLDTGVRSTYARGLTMPNGLEFLPNGDAVVSRSIGTGTGITRVPAADPAQVERNWVRTNDSNGMAVDPSGRWLYYVETFTVEAAVRRVSISDPSRVEVVARLGDPSGRPKALDDMTIDRDGILYIVANFAGEVISLDPATGASCVIANGLESPSAIKFGRGPGFPTDHLYVSGFDGRVRELRPPPGATRGGLAPPPSASPDGPRPPAVRPRPRRCRRSASRPRTITQHRAQRRSQRGRQHARQRAGGARCRRR